jgi:hypothetical protein
VHFLQIWMVTGRRARRPATIRSTSPSLRSAASCG